MKFSSLSAILRPLLDFNRSFFRRQFSELELACDEKCEFPPEIEPKVLRQSEIRNTKKHVSLFEKDGNLELISVSKYSHSKYSAPISLLTLILFKIHHKAASETHNFPSQPLIRLPEWELFRRDRCEHHWLGQFGEVQRVQPKMFQEKEK